MLGNKSIPTDYENDRTATGTLAPYELVEVTLGMVVSRNVNRLLKGAPDPCRYVS